MQRKKDKTNFILAHLCSPSTHLVNAFLRCQVGMSKRYEHTCICFEVGWGGLNPNSQSLDVPVCDISTYVTKQAKHSMYTASSKTHSPTSVLAMP